jgi:putative transposase
MRYAWIDKNRASFPVSVMCRVLKVSTSGFYKSLRATPSKRAQRAEAIRTSVRSVYEQFQGIYGSYKIADQLKVNTELESACRNTVARAMREMELKSRVCKKFRPVTTVQNPAHTPAPNLLRQDFRATAPNQKWVGDITYLPTAAGWVYLAVIIDLFSRKVVGWAMSDRLTTPLVSEALKRAIESRRPRPGQLVHHSDRGCQYTSEAFQNILAGLGIECSMSRTGCCYDNAVAERFFWSLKHEWTKHETFGDLEEARWSVFKYIDAFYNSVRIHQTLNYQTPNQIDAQFEATTAA